MKFHSLRLTCIILFISILTTIFLLAGNTKAIAQDENSCISCHTSLKKIIPITRELAAKKPALKSSESSGEG